MGQISSGVFLLYDLVDEKPPVCEIVCFDHNVNTIWWVFGP